MVNVDHGNSEAAVPSASDDSNMELRGNSLTKDDGRKKDDEADIRYCTQAVLPPEPQAFLRFLEKDHLLCETLDCNSPLNPTHNFH
jgi:hypothetical protein